MEREKQKVLEGERQAEEARREEEARMKAKKEAEDELQRRLEAGEQVAPLKSKFVSVNYLLLCHLYTTISTKGEMSSICEKFLAV